VRNEIDRLGRGVDRVACLTAPKQETSRAGDRDASWIETLAAPSESEVALARAWRGAFFFPFPFGFGALHRLLQRGIPQSTHHTHARAGPPVRSPRARVVGCAL
jgi:hypothetical protein